MRRTVRVDRVLECLSAGSIGRVRQVDLEATARRRRGPRRIGKLHLEESSELTPLIAAASEAPKPRTRSASQALRRARADRKGLPDHGRGRRRTPNADAVGPQLQAHDM